MRTLVLNAGYEPLAVVSFKRALVLVLCGKAAILATDVDTDALDAARRGVYRLQALQGAGLERLRPHFLKGTGTNAELARVRPEGQAMVDFAPRSEEHTSELQSH